MPKSRSHAILWAGVLVVLLDIITKIFAIKWLPYGEAVPVFPLFNLSLRFNTGVAFSLFADGSVYTPWIITCIAITALVIFAIWYTRVDQSRSAERLGIVLIMGGAFGNVIDRFYYGHVVDFIEVYYQQYFWPAFNIADASICIGAGLVIWSTLRGDYAKS